jgi:Ca2+-binding EF-hand superfamily protein
MNQKVVIGVLAVAIVVIGVGVVGALSPKERYMPAGPASASGGPKITGKQLVASMDANGDGFINFDEAPEQVQKAFAFVDTNQDGGIDASEAQFMADYANNMGGAEASAAATGGKMTAEQMVSYMDADKDGMISMSEAPAQLKEGFSFIDVNQDGGIDVVEAQVMADEYNKGQVQ